MTGEIISIETLRIYQATEQENKELQETKEKAIKFLPVADFFCNKMALGQTKDMVLKTLVFVKAKGFFNGYIL